jgi:ATP-dependent protease ClpP protease subunit
MTHQPGADSFRDTPLAAHHFRDPAILLSGPVDQEMYDCFRKSLEKAPESGLVVVEMSTLGGDPEVARMIGEDVRFHSETEPQRQFIFLGKTALYSAGTTLMSFFRRENRYLTPGTRLMIHERQNRDCMVRLEGPVSSAVAVLKAKLHEMETAIAIQNEGFANLVRGSDVSLEEVVKRAINNWYIGADEAVSLGIVRAVI